MCTFESGLRDESRRRRKGRPVALRPDVRTEHLTEGPSSGRPVRCPDGHLTEFPPGAGPGLRHRCESGVLYSADTRIDTRRPISNQKINYPRRDYSDRTADSPSAPSIEHHSR